MKINQLFSDILSENVLIQLLNCYGLKDLNDKHTFKKNDLIYLNTVSKINEIKPIIEKYYLPCKAKIYLHDLNEKKAITLLRQILKLFDYHIESKERNINTKKTIFYTLTSNKEYEMKTMKSCNSNIIISFN